MNTYKVIMSTEAFGERLGAYINKSREIEVEHNWTFNIIDDSQETLYDMDDVFGLLCAVGSIRNDLQEKILGCEPEGTTEYAIDVFSKRGDDKPYIQIDCDARLTGFTDLRFKAEVFDKFGYNPGILQLVHNVAVNFDNK